MMRINRQRGSKPRVRAAFLTLLLGVFCCGVASAQSVVFVVRHAERLDQSTDSPLSPSGEQRAQRLAMHLKDAGISRMYTSQFQRTALTAEPLAKVLGIRAETVPAAETPELLRRVAHGPSTGAVLIVGHSNTIPEILAGLGIREPVTVLESQYDGLFIVAPGAERPILIRLRF